MPLLQDRCTPWHAFDDRLVDEHDPDGDAAYERKARTRGLGAQGRRTAMPALRLSKQVSSRVANSTNPCLFAAKADC